MNITRVRKYVYLLNHADILNRCFKPTQCSKLLSLTNLEIVVLQLQLFALEAKHVTTMQSHSPNTHARSRMRKD